jgi:hypothetical protein
MLLQGGVRSATINDAMKPSNPSLVGTEGSSLFEIGR